MTSSPVSPPTQGVGPGALKRGKVGNVLTLWRGYILRKLLHASVGGLLAALGFLLPTSVLTLAAGLALSLLAVEVVRFAWPRLNECLVERFGALVKDREARGVTGVTYLALASVLVFALFDPRIAALALAYTALGDPVAGLVGDRYGQWRWKGKSVEGAFAFLVAGAVAGFVLAAVGMEMSLPARLLGAAIAAGMEVLPFALDDNVTAPVASAAAMTLIVSLGPAL